MTTTTIHFIRHGEVHNPDHILYARLPRFRLSTRGRQQAAAAAAYLAAHPLAAIIASPRLRARQTAQIVAAPHAGLAVRQSRLLDEIDTPHQGRPIAELEAADWPLYATAAPPYEQPADIMARVERLITRLRHEYAGQEVAAVTHGDIVLAAWCWAQDETFDDTTKRYAPYPATASITTLTFNGASARPAVTRHTPY
ncbi:MAG: histidine phosphatase family protein [Anaerolineae bacterium]|nr:histidine phosphatase family protein [Anaerolineae bacterium]